MPVEDLEDVQLLPPCVVSAAPALEILPLAQQRASAFRLPPTVRLPIVVAFPLHWSDPTVAAPVQLRAPIVYVAVASRASLRYDAVDVIRIGAWHTRPLMSKLAVSQMA